jgi:glycosyltransferase 2 family protein
MTDRSRARRRLAVSAGALALTMVPASRADLPKIELEVFDAVNHLPDSLFRPIWPVMQLGALAAIPVTAGIAASVGQRAIAHRMVFTGTTTWVTAKVIKRCVRRGRPVTLVPGVHVRGHAASGQGFLSGHAGIAAALAATALPARPELGPVLATVVVAVGLARIYVGAHLPLDVVGGAALGVTVDALVTAVRQ